MTQLPPRVTGINDLIFEPAYLLQMLMNGLGNGAIYALMALTVVLVYRTSGHLNFAQGEMGTISAFIVFTLAVTHGVPYWVAIPLVLVLAFLCGAGVQRFLVWPVERRGGLDVVLVTLGLFMIITAVDAAVWGPDPVGALTPFPSGPDDQFVILDGPPQFAVKYSTIGIWVVLALVATGLWWLMNRTKLGLAYRAVAANPDSAVLVGVPKSRVLMFGWGLAAVVGALAAIGFSQLVGSMDYTLMLQVLLYGLAAAAVGGFDSAKGAVVGGLLVGVVESLVPATFSFIGSELSLLMALVIIICVLLVRPQGLFGTTRVERV